MATDTELYRVAIRTDRDEIDLCLSAHIPIRHLMNGITEALTTADTSSLQVHSIDMVLSRPGADPFDISQSLAQCGVCTGDVLNLLPKAPQHSSLPSDIYSAVSDVVRSVSRQWPPYAIKTVFAVISCWSLALAGVLMTQFMLTLSEHRHTGLAAIAIITSEIALVLAALWQRSYHLNTAIILAFMAIALAAIGGWFLVPHGFHSGNALLSSSTAALTALLTAHFIHCRTLLFNVISGILGATALVTCGAVLTWWPISACGPLLIIGASVILTAAVSLAHHRLKVSITDPVDDAVIAHTKTAHTYLNTVVMTSSGIAALGGILTLACTAPTWSVIGLMTASSVVLLCRTIEHHDTYRRMSLFAATLISITTLLLCGATTMIIHTGWLCGILTTIAIAASGLAYTVHTSHTPGVQDTWNTSFHHGVRRIIKLLDFIATAAIIPLGLQALDLLSFVYHIVP